MDNNLVAEKTAPSIHMVYQPVARITQDELEVVAYESLLRVSPNRCNHTTFSIITDAEEAGTIPTLDARIARLACSDAAKLDGMNLWMNMSQVTLSYPPAAKQIADVILENGLSGRVTVEITETADGKVPLLLESIQLLKNENIAVVIDDIEDGFAKSHLLRSDLIAGCKLSRNSTARMLEDPYYMEAVDRLIRWCKSIGKTVVIEGVENSFELNIVKALGADFYQGFHLWKPASLIDLPAPGTRKRIITPRSQANIPPCHLASN